MSFCKAFFIILKIINFGIQLLLLYFFLESFINYAKHFKSYRQVTSQINQNQVKGYFVKNGVSTTNECNTQTALTWTVQVFSNQISKFQVGKEAYLNDFQSQSPFNILYPIGYGGLLGLMIMVFMLEEASASAKQNNMQMNNYSSKKKGLSGVRQQTLRTHSQWRILHQMIKAVMSNAISPESNYYLVVDKHSTQILDSVCSVIDLQQNHISLVQSLDLVRKKFPNRDAIYLVSPRGDSIKKIINDYSDPKKPQYGGVHLFFTTKVPNPLFELLGGCRELVRRVRNFCEINVDFLFHDHRNTFIFNDIYQQSTFSSPLQIYSSDQSIQDNFMIKQTTSRLFTVCTTLNEFPYIQFYDRGGKGQKSPAKMIAGSLHTRLKNFYTKNKENIPFNTTNRGFLLVLDRSFDLAAPVLHDLTYGQMIYDFLLPSIDNQNQNLSSRRKFQIQYKDGTYIIDDPKDMIWNKYRGKHIAQVLVEMPKQTAQFTSQAFKNSTIANTMNDPDGEEIKVKDVREKLIKQPKQKDLLTKFKANTNIALQIRQIYKQRNLSQLIDLQQLIISGVDDEGKVVSNRAIMDHISKKKKDLGQKQMLRLLWLYLSMYDVPDKDFFQVVNTNVSSMRGRKILKNIRYLGAASGKKTGKTQRRVRQISAQEYKQYVIKQNAVQHAIMKKTSRLVKLIQNMREKAMDLEQFPFIEMPQDYKRVKKQQQAKSKRKKIQNAILDDDEDDEDDDQNGLGSAKRKNPRIIVFVIGGISYEEVLEVQVKFGNDVGIIVGGSSIMNPEQFLKAVETIDQQDEDDDDDEDEQQHNGGGKKAVLDLGDVKLDM